VSRRSLPLYTAHRLSVYPVPAAIVFKCWMPLLSRAFRLHDVDDVEGLARRALGDQLRSIGAHLSGHEHEDAVTFLIETTWEASLRYDPERSSSFSRFSYRLCRRRTIDFIRQRNGRTRWQFSSWTHTRTRPEVLSLDGPGGSELEPALGRGQRDFADDRCPDLGRILAG
jgi:DNA-directed RNA polymerase specialized sigma24 family protein